MPVAVVSSGTTVSSAVLIEPAYAGLSIESPGSVVGQVRLQFASGLDASSAAFFTLHKPDGSATPWIVSSGPGSVVLPYPPTQYVRVQVAQAHAFPMSFSLHPRVVF